MVWDLLNVFEANTNWMYRISTSMNLFQNIINALRTVLLLVLGFMSFNQSTIPLGPIDNMIHKHM
jgi:hypothetical protein